MSNRNQSAGGGVSFGFLLFLLFLGLKLGHVITWSWWWVTAPLWAPLAAVIVFILGCALVAGLCSIGISTVDRKEAKERSERVAARRVRDGLPARPAPARREHSTWRD